MSCAHIKNSLRQPLAPSHNIHNNDNTNDSNNNNSLMWCICVGRRFKNSLVDNRILCAHGARSIFANRWVAELLMLLMMIIIIKRKTFALCCFRCAPSVARLYRQPAATCTRATMETEWQAVTLNSCIRSRIHHAYTLKIDKVCCHRLETMQINTINETYCLPQWNI